MQGNMAFNTVAVLLLLLLAGTANGARIGASAGAGKKASAVSALLSELYLSVGTLDPEFDPAEFTYTVSLNSSVSEIEIYVEAPPDQVSAGCGVSVNGTWVDSGEYSPSITLRDPGRTTTITIYVLAVGYSPASYTLYVKRAAEKSSGGLSWWIILLIVIAVLVVLALLGYLIYWLFQHGYCDWIPGVAERRSAGGGSEYQPISH